MTSLPCMLLLLLLLCCMLHNRCRITHTKGKRPAQDTEPTGPSIEQIATININTTTIVNVSIEPLGERKPQMAGMKQQPSHRTHSLLLAALLFAVCEH